MYLKRVNEFFSKSLSIKGQLTFLYSIATFIIILGISICFYFAILTIFQNADRQFLADEISMFNKLLEVRPMNLQALKAEIIDIPNSSGSLTYHYFVRIFDENNVMIMQTQNMPFSKSIKVKEKFGVWRKVNGKKYLLMTTPLVTQKKQANGFIQIALDVSYQEVVINQYKTLVFLLILSAALISVLLGYLISKRALSRLVELTLATQMITANSLCTTISPQYWPRELNELGVAYNQMLERIAKSIESLTRLSDDLAHELRAPITNLMGETEIALSQSLSNEEYKQILISNLEELNRLYHIIENLLFLARAENPQIDLQKSLLDLGNEVEMMRRFYQALADEKNIQISCQGTGSLHLNSVMIRRMIGNLLSNAIKYSNDGSKIQIKIVNNLDQFIHVSVEDSGQGIPPQHIPHLFERFYQVDRSRNQHPGSVGLGLAIVKSIVDLHHGTIAITSIMHKGTCVSIKLPK